MIKDIKVRNTSHSHSRIRQTAETIAERMGVEMVWDAGYAGGDVAAPVIGKGVAERCVAVVQQIASIRPDVVPAWLVATWDEAGEIAALLTPPVDPDLVTAREIVARHEACLNNTQHVARVNAGEYDNSVVVSGIVAALRKAREEGPRA